MPNAEITAGGGANIFASLKQSWTSVSWEQVRQGRPSVHRHQQLQHPHRGPERTVPGDQPDHQEPHRGQEPLLPPLSYNQVTPSPTTPKPSSPSPTGSTPPPSACPLTAHDPEYAAPTGKPGTRSRPSPAPEETRP